VRHESFEHVERAEQCIHRLHHRRAAAPRFISLQPDGTEAVGESLAGMREDARIGPSETVDRLFRIAHDEHRRLHLTRCVGVEPVHQHLPLQRIGVLELVEQQMTVTRVQTGLHERTCLRVRQQARGVPFQIAEIEHAGVALDAVIRIEQCGRHAQAVIVEGPGSEIGERGQTLRSADDAMHSNAACAASAMPSFPVPCRA
jgi:hypothetical protein